MVRTCLAKLADGRSLIVFPEGTRSLDGNLRTFYRGAFSIATRAKVAVVPIVLDGTGGILKKGSMLIRPRHVTVNILDPIDPASVGFDSRKLRDVTHEVMTRELAKMRKETR
jgi:1-acyl-sn-glycerol-3-phosphate acyltransferase